MHSRELEVSRKDQLTENGKDEKDSQFVRRISSIFIKKRDEGYRKNLISTDVQKHSHEGTEIWKTRHTYNLGRGERTDFYIIKRLIYDPKTRTFIRTGKEENPAKFERNLLEIYSAVGGCYVPRPYDAWSEDGDGFLMMEYLGTDSLEKRIRRINIEIAPEQPGKAKSEKERLVRRVLQALDCFHYAGRVKEQEILRILNTTRRPRDLEEKTKKYYRHLVADDEQIISRRELPKMNGEDDFFQTFDVVIRNIMLERQQPIHGDIKTSHIFFAKDRTLSPRIWFIDLGSCKLGYPSLDMTDLLFSPQIHLPIDRVIAIYREYLETIEPDKKKIREKIRILHYAALLEFLKLASHYKIRRLVWGKEWSRTTAKIYSDTDPSDYCKDQSIKIIEALTSKGPYQADKRDVAELEELKPIMGKVLLKRSANGQT